MTGSSHSTAELVNNLFITVSILEAKDIMVRSIALPVLGAGYQGIDDSYMMNLLLESAIKHFSRSASIERILFVEKNSQRAEALDQAMNTVLKRSKVVLPINSMVAGVKKEILEKIKHLKEDCRISNGIIAEMQEIIMKDNLKSVDLGVVGRKLVEAIAQEMIPDKHIVLYQKIQSLHYMGVSEWVLSYMHVLRILGNEAVHKIDCENRFPKQLDESDLLMCLFAIQRIIDFWGTYCKHQQDYCNKRMMQIN